MRQGRQYREFNSPFGRLPATNIGCRLLGFFTKSSRAVRILLSDRLPVGEVLCAVHNDHERADGRAVDAHVREDARGMHPVERVRLDEFGGHLDSLLNPSSGNWIGEIEKAREVGPPTKLRPVSELRGVEYNV